jgi:hypothetical protein
VIRFSSTSSPRDLRKQSWWISRFRRSSLNDQGFRCFSGHSHFLLQTDRRQLFKVPDIKRVDTFYRASCRATEQKSIVNLRAGPSAACHRVQRIQIVLFAEGHNFKMRPNVIGDDARRFDRVYTRLDP